MTPGEQVKGLIPRTETRSAPPPFPRPRSPPSAHPRWGISAGLFLEFGMRLVKSALQLNSKAPSAPRCFRSPGLSPTGWWRGRGSNSQAKSHPTFGVPPLRMRNISDQILVRSGPRMRRFSGRYRGGAANIVGGLPPRHSGKLHFAPNSTQNPRKRTARSHHS